MTYKVFFKQGRGSSWTVVILGKAPVMGGCPVDGHRVIKYGFRPAIVELGAVCLVVRVQRMRCTHCGRTFSITPAFVVPGQRLMAKTVRFVVEAHAKGQASLRKLADRVNRSVATVRRLLRTWGNRAPLLQDTCR